jgi:plasmid stabilization system protein ParE
MNLEWSREALADLSRFATFLSDKHPALAKRVAQEILSKAEILTDHPQLGRPLAGREEYRQIVLQILNARYVFQYRYDGKRMVMLRVFHGRETRE